MAGAMVGGWFGQAIVDKLVNTVTSYLQDQINWGANIKAALNKLQVALLPIRAAVREAGKVELDMDQKPELVEWIWKLRDAVEEAEDVVDKMEYYLLERQILERDAADTTASSSRKFKVNSTLLIRNIDKFGKRAFNTDPIVHKLNTVVDNLKSVNENINDFNNFIKQSATLHSGNLLASKIDNTRETGNELSVDEVIGQEQYKERVIKWLKESDGFDKVSAFNIWGLGGVGKTTLAQTLYNDVEHLKDFFQVKMWVCISNNNFNMKEIMKKAIESDTGDTPQSSSMSTLQEKVKEIVSSKRSLLVLDDVWDGQNNQNSQEWEKFVGLFSKYAEKGSKILITSRIKSIAKNILQTQTFQKEEYQLACLEEKESLVLFNKHAFAGANPDKYMNLWSKGKEIAKKCGGLPLALKIIGGTLNAKLDFSYWNSILKKNILHLDKGTDNLKEILKYSYHSLPSNLQSCFRLCSLFPQDYKYEENELVALWMAAGCILETEDRNKLPEDIGHDYLNILVTRSFFVSQGGRRYVMHDLLHDLARDVSRGECLRVEDNNIPEQLPQTLRHLFVGELNTNLFKKISSLKKLRTLSLDLRFSSHGLDDLPKHLKSLRALLFSNVRFMPNLNAIGKLIHLRLLHMDGGYVLDKPFKPLYKLYHLQNLKWTNVSGSCHPDLISGSKLDCISNLIKLRHIIIHKIVFKRISQVRHLTALQELWLVMNEENAFKFSDLNDLNMLRDVTIIYDREVGISVEEAELANLKEKKHLVSLTLQLNHLDPQLHEQISNCLQPPLESNIKKLEIRNYTGVQSISWMNADYLPCVSVIELSDCPNLKHLPPLGELPCLRVLSLENIPCVTQLGSCFFGSNETIRGFPSLEELNIVNMDSFEEWTGADIAGWFPCLKELKIERCKCLKVLPSLPVSLKRLTLESVGLVVVPAWQDSNVPALEVLKIKHCEELVKCDQLSLNNCVSLKKLEILKCPKLSSLYDIYSQNLATLNYLTIEGCNELIVAAANQQNATCFLFHVKKVVIDSLFLLEIETFRSITSAEELIVKGDKQSTFFPHQWLLHSLCLTELRIREVPLLKSLPEIPSTLKELRIENLPLLKSLPDKMPSSLTVLYIENLPLLESLPEMPSSLTQLRIKHLPLFKSLPEMPSTLRDLYIENVPLFKSLPEMPSTLRDLHIENVPVFKSLQEMPSTLRHLYIENVPLLKSLPEMPSSLTQLRIYNVPLLESLPEMPSSLTQLHINNCPQLVSLPGKMPPKLFWLEIEECPLLEERCFLNTGSTVSYTR